MLKKLLFLSVALGAFGCSDDDNGGGSSNGGRCTRESDCADYACDGGLPQCGMNGRCYCGSSVAANSPAAGEIVINEVKIKKSEDFQEFIELVNVTDKTLDLAGLKVSSYGTKVENGLEERFVLSSGKLAPKGAVAIMTGGEWIWSANGKAEGAIEEGNEKFKCGFPDSPALIDPEEGSEEKADRVLDVVLSLGTQNGEIEISRFSGSYQQVFSSSTYSATRLPDLSDEIAKHSQAESGLKASPAKCANGAEFENDCIIPPCTANSECECEANLNGVCEDGVCNCYSCTPETRPNAGELVINEVMVTGDEFIELVNRTNHELCLDKLQLSSSKGNGELAKRFVLGSGKLGANEAVAIFKKDLPWVWSGNGECTSETDGVTLNFPDSMNADVPYDVFELRNIEASPDAPAIDTFRVPREMLVKNVSVGRSPDLTGDAMLQSEIVSQGTVTPAQCNNGAALSDQCKFTCNSAADCNASDGMIPDCQNGLCLEVECLTASDCGECLVGSAVCDNHFCVPCACIVDNDCPDTCPDGQVPACTPNGCDCAEPNDPCKNAVSASEGSLVINEVMVNGPGGIEFVELVNVTNDVVSLKGVKMYASKTDGTFASSAKFTLKDRCLTPKGAVAIWKKPHAWVWNPPMPIMSSDEVSGISLSLPNSGSGDKMLYELRVACDDNDESKGECVVNTLTVDPQYLMANESVTRNPDLNQESTVANHTSVSECSFSAATCINGNDFTEGCNQYAEHAVSCGECSFDFDCDCNSGFVPRCNMHVCECEEIECTSATVNTDCTCNGDEVPTCDGVHCGCEPAPVLCSNSNECSCEGNDVPVCSNGQCDCEPFVSSCEPAEPGDLVINELMIKGSTGEFVEIVNKSTKDIALGDVTLYGNQGSSASSQELKSKLAFGNGCLQASGTVVVYKAEAWKWMPESAKVEPCGKDGVSNSSFSLVDSSNLTGEDGSSKIFKYELRNSDGTVLNTASGLMSLVVSGSSITRDPDVLGDFVLSSSLNESTTATPGFCNDGVSELPVCH